MSFHQLLGDASRMRSQLNEIGDSSGIGFRVQGKVHRVQGIALRIWGI